MPGCIKDSPEGIQTRQTLLNQAEMTGSKMMPYISQFCPAHNQHHVLKMEGAAVDVRYGQGVPPIEVNLSQEEESAEKTFQNRAYCNICQSYHRAGACTGPRTRESVGS